MPELSETTIPETAEAYILNTRHPYIKIAIGAVLALMCLTLFS